MPSESISMTLNPFEQKIEQATQKLAELRKSLISINTFKEAKDLITKTELLFDEVADFKDRSPYPGPKEKQQNSRVDNLRDKIDLFLMEEVWPRRDYLNS